MSLLLVVVLLFFSSSSSVSSHQYYVSDDCSSVTHTPCNPLSVYAGNMSQYSNTIFYFIGTSSINFNFTMESVQNVTLHGLDHSPTIYCKNNTGFIAIDSSHVYFSNISFQGCNMDFETSSNIMITGSIFKYKNLGYVSLTNVIDSKITSSVFDNVLLLILYVSPSMCYNEFHHYSLTLTYVNMTGKYSQLALSMYHGTLYNLSAIIDNVNIINVLYGVHLSFSESLFSLFITNSSVSNSDIGLQSVFHTWQSTKCNIKGVQLQSTIITEDSQFHNNNVGLAFLDYYQFSTHHIIITVKSCSICDNDDYGLVIEGRLSTSTHISVINTELVGNKRNEITGCHSIILNNITVTNSLSTGLVIIASVVTVENRLVFNNNTGVVGGGIAINGSSVVALSKSAYLEFIGNHASYKGGGIYIDQQTHSLFIHKNRSVSPIPLISKNNTAGVAGNDIYGVIYLPHFNDLFNSSTNPSTSSDPITLAFCNPNSNETTPIWDYDEQQSVFLGETLKYNVAFFWI